MRVAIASVLDPRSPATWSSFPYQAIQALERHGVETVPVTARVPLPRRLLGFIEYQLRMRGLSFSLWRRPDLGMRRALVFGRSDYLRLRSMRAHHAKLLKKRLVSAGVDRVIHMGAFTMSPDHNGAVEHYLVCDTTWHALTADAAAGQGFPVSLARRFEEIERSLFAHVSHFFPWSRHCAHDLESHYGVDPERITVIGTGTGWIEPFDGEKDYANARVLFVGKERFEEKGGPLLLEAFHRAAETFDGLSLTVVGENRYTRELAGLRNVTVHGRLPQGDELTALFREASIFAMPSLVEPWGLVYLEALASKTPVLGLRRAAFPEIAAEGRYGFIVDEPTPEAVSGALVQALSDPARLRRMGEEGQRHCLSTYSWDRVAERIEAVLRSPGRGGLRWAVQADEDLETTAPRQLRPADL